MISDRYSLTLACRWISTWPPVCSIDRKKIMASGMTMK